MDLLDVPNRSPFLLYPGFREKLDRGLARCHAKGLNVYLFEGYRSKTRQDWLYRQGRSRPGKIVTKAQGGQSNHQYGLAGDLVFKDAKGDWTWVGDYEAVAVEMKAEGLEWYGDPDSGFDEKPHFQFKSPVKIYSMQQMIVTGQSVLDVWALIDVATTVQRIKT